MEATPRIALVTGSLPPHDVCGVGDYSFRLHERLDGVELLHISPCGDLFRVYGGRALVHVQYPTEGWGNSVLPSLMGLAKRGTKLLVTLHEWSQMNRLRRATLGPLIRAADGFVFVTPFERDAFLAATGSRKPTWVVPIGVNLTVPAIPEAEVIAFRSAELEKGHDLLVSHFGFIHAAKQPEKLLDAIVALKAAGRRPKLMVIGGFQTDKPAEQEAFLTGVHARGLAADVDLKGFVKDDTLAATMMAAADANVSLFAEGLSSRRGSFWYAAQHGNVLVTTQARDPREFGEAMGKLVGPQFHFVAKDAIGSEIAAPLARLPQYMPFRYPPLPAPKWEEIAARHREIYADILAASR